MRWITIAIIIQSFVKFRSMVAATEVTVAAVMGQWGRWDQWGQWGHRGVREWRALPGRQGLQAVSYTHLAFVNVVPQGRKPRLDMEEPGGVIQRGNSTLLHSGQCIFTAFNDTGFQLCETVTQGKNTVLQDND